jgi:hypothetical protein
LLTQASQYKIFALRRPTVRISLIDEWFSRFFQLHIHMREMSDRMNHPLKYEKVEHVTYRSKVQHALEHTCFSRTSLRRIYWNTITSVHIKWLIYVYPFYVMDPQVFTSMRYKRSLIENPSKQIHWNTLLAP